MPAARRQGPSLIYRSSSGTVAGSRPAASDFLYVKESHQRRTQGGYAPLTPRPRRAFGPKGRGPVPRIEVPAYSSPSAAAPQAQRLCPRVSGTLLPVRSGRHGRFFVARSVHGGRKTRPFRAFARKARAGGSAARFSALSREPRCTTPKERRPLGGAPFCTYRPHPLEAPATRAEPSASVPWVRPNASAGKPPERSHRCARGDRMVVTFPNKKDGPLSGPSFHLLPGFDKAQPIHKESPS